MAVKIPANPQPGETVSMTGYQTSGSSSTSVAKKLIGRTFGASGTSDGIAKKLIGRKF